MQQKPNIIRTRRETRSTPPQAVKSIFVWKAKMVSARQMTAQIPAATSTSLTFEKMGVKTCKRIRSVRFHLFVVLVLVSG